MSASEADEARLLRAAHDLPPDAPLPEEVAAAALESEAVPDNDSRNVHP